jgi:hypothetical protein
VKQALDKAIDGMQAQTGEHAEKAIGAVKTAADKLQEKIQNLGGDKA